MINTGIGIIFLIWSGIVMADGPGEPGSTFFSDIHSPKVRNWVSMQNQRFSDLLTDTQFRNTLKERYSELQAKNLPIPNQFWRGELAVNSSGDLTLKRTDGSILVLFRPSSLGTTAAIADSILSPDGSKVAIAINYGGSDVQFWYFYDLASESLLGDDPIRIRFKAINWNLNSSGVFYSVWPNPEEEQVQMKKGIPRRVDVAFHQLGNSRNKDAVILKNLAPIPSEILAVRELIPDKVFMSFPEQGGVRLPLRLKIGIKLGDTIQWSFSLINNHVFGKIIGQKDDEVFFEDSSSGANFGLSSFKYSRQPQWKTIISSQKHKILTTVFLFNDKFVAQYIDKLLRPFFQVYDFTGKLLKSVYPDRDLGMGLLGSFGFNRTDAFVPAVYFNYGTFSEPTRTYRMSLSNLEIKRVPETGPHPYDLGSRVSKQVHFIRSFDGTKVPVQIFRRADSKEKPRFAYIYYYGAISTMELSGYSPFRQLVLEMGGAFVVVNARGGAERGLKWFQEGANDKIKTVQDIVSTARWIKKKLEIPENRIVGQGGSYGGLHSNIIAALFPNDFDILIPQIPLSDITLIPHSYVLWAFLDDLGFARDKNGYLKDFDKRMKEISIWSPVQNIGKMKKVPWLLTVMGANDERAGQDQGYLFTYELLRKFGNDTNVYLIENPIGGHGVSTEQKLDSLAFIAQRYDIHNLNALDEAK